MAMALRNLIASPGNRIMSAAKPVGILPATRNGSPSSRRSDHAEAPTHFPHDSPSCRVPDQHPHDQISHSSLVVDDVAISELPFLANHTDLLEHADLLSETEVLAFLDLNQEASTCLPAGHASSEVGKTCCIEKRKRSASGGRSETKNHVVIERARRKGMSDLLEKVRGLLPDPILKRKDHKATLISRFIEHITAQKQKLEELKKKREDLEGKKSPSDPKCDLSENINVGDHDRLNNINQNVCVAPSLPHVVPYVRIHASGENACNISINCTKNPRIFHAIVKTINEHRLQLVNVHMASNETMMSYNLHSKVKDGSSFCKDDLQTKLQQLMIAI